jgi:hypothetical protein
VQVALLTAGVILRLPGMAVAAGAFTLAALVEWAYLARAAARHRAGAAGAII